MSEESKEKMRKAKLRNPVRYWKGKHISPVHRAKLFSGNSRWQEVHGHPRSGTKRSEKERLKISETLKRKYASGEIVSPFVEKWRSGEFGFGPKSPRYDPNAPRDGQRYRRSFEYKEWRDACVKRDQYTCQLCKKKGGKLEVDHYPRSFARLMREGRYDLLKDIRNGRTLCRGCHLQFGERSVKKDFRGAFIAALIDMARKDNRVCLIVNDVGFSRVETFQQEFPKRFFNFGVTEMATNGIAAGMALSGLRPFVYSMLNFSVFRPFEILRGATCHQNAPVTIVGVTGSSHFRMLGISHNPVPDDEDVRVLSHLPNIKIHIPKSAEETERAVHEAVESNCPNYIRL